MKLTAMVIAGAVTTILLWVLETWASVDPPTAVANAIVIVVAALLGFLAPERNVPRSAKQTMLKRGWQPSPEDRYLLRTGKP